MGRRPLIAGNWKMFGRVADLAEIEALGRAAPSFAEVDVAICPPATLIALAARGLGDSSVRIGAQDCHPGDDGAQTGDVNAAMLADAGARYCIVGHSERRRDHGESDALVADKSRAVSRAGMTPIICVGESLEQRKSGGAIDIVTAQLAASAPEDAASATVIAYEPVWAIGTGLTPSLAEIGDMHAALRRTLEQRFGARGGAMRVLYGGSVKPSNAAEIFGVPGVDGALVGGASLKADDFAAIIRAHPAAGGR
jgi:triosephosphate isomerase